MEIQEKKDIKETKRSVINYRDLFQRCLSIKILMTVSTVSFLLINAILLLVVNFSTSFSSLYILNAQKDKIILTHTRKVTYDFLNHVFHLPFDYKDRLELYPGELNFTSQDFVEYVVDQVSSMMNALAYSSILRISLADMDRNIIIFDHKGYRSPDKIQLWQSFAGEYVYNKEGEVVGEDFSSGGGCGPLHRTPIYVDSEGDPYLVHEKADIKKYFAPESLKWYQAGRSDDIKLKNDSKTVESLCVCGYLYLFTAIKLFDDNGEQRAIAGSALAVDEIGLFLEELSLDIEIVVLINKKTHHIMASNMGAEVISNKFIDDEGYQHLHLANESTYPLLRDVYTEVLLVTDNYKKDVDELFSNGRNINKHIVYAQTFMVSEMEFIAFSMIPSIHVFESTLLSFSVGIGSAVVFFLVGSVVSFIVGCLIRQQFARVIKKMKRVEEMDLDISIKPERFSILEIFEINRGFSFMVNKLKEYRAFIPPELLQLEETHHRHDRQISQVSSECYGSEDQESTNLTLSTEGSSLSTSSDSMVRKLFNIGLNLFRDGTVICVNLYMDNGVSSRDYSEQTISSSFFQYVSTIVKRHEGNILTFNDTKTVTIGWNINRTCRNHFLLGCSCAVSLVEGFDAIMMRFPDVRIAVGLAMEGVRVVTIGTAERKRVMYEGKGIRFSKTFAQISKEHSLPIVTSAVVKDSIIEKKKDVFNRFVFTAFDVLVGSDSSFKLIYVLDTDLKLPQNQEWIYYLPRMNANEDNVEVEEALGKIMKGDLEWELNERTDDSKFSEKVNNIKQTIKRRKLLLESEGMKSIVVKRFQERRTKNAKGWFLAIRDEFY